MLKSSQAARNSCLSAARNSGSRRRQAGSILKNVNLAKVRSATALTIALGLALLAPAGAGAKQGTAGTLAWLPAGTTLSGPAGAGLAPGVMSPGLGTVSPAQTYLDVSAGNRVFNSLYDSELLIFTGDCPSWLQAAEARGQSAPADIVPGLLSKTLRGAGIAVRAGGGVSCAVSASAIPSGPGDSAGSVVVRDATLGDLGRIRGSGLLIAIARPKPDSDDLVPIGIAGPSFDGNLTSDSTRTDGYVLSTDVAPTILDQFGLEIPDEMSGQPIRSESSVDVAEIESLVDRMEVISPRRGPVI